MGAFFDGGSRVGALYRTAELEMRDPSTDPTNEGTGKIPFHAVLESTTTRIYGGPRGPNTFDQHHNTNAQEGYSPLVR
jgi:hypothetical protein